MWTSARYSDEVVQSMIAAVQTFVNSRDSRHIVLVGYSGGGTLAMLMAPRLKNVKGVVTIAGNLDVDAWTTKHQYATLIGSLNPAALSDSRIPTIHMIGLRDDNIPPAILARYFAQHPSAQVWRYPDFDHVCCWASDWPDLLARANDYFNR